jgi:coenzyme F420-0:L-glutamate ligase/coenzyme F420-1:gamma-L-glutamate ligase
VASGDLWLDARPLPGLPELHAGDDLPALIARVASDAEFSLSGGDVLVIAQKAVSKAEGRLRALSEVEPTPRAFELAERLGKEARLVQVVLDESAEIIRADRGVLIARTRQGYVCANAGVDLSNVPGEAATLLPEDPDASARRIRDGIERAIGARPAVVISDSFGRPWRLGQVDVALGCAGLAPLEDLRGGKDSLGRELSATVQAVADEAAAAAGLVRSKAGREAVVLVRGLERHITADDGPGAAALLRQRAEDLFR